jgi:hypothetical protein
MNPLLKHTLDKLNKPDADPVCIIGEAFMSLLKQASDNPKLNLCGGDAVDENTAKYIQSPSIFDDYVSLCAKDKMPKLCTHILHNFFTGWTDIFYRKPKRVAEIPDHLSDYMPDIPPISNVMTCRNRMLQGKRLPNCAEICSRGFDKVPKLKRECEIPDYWLE